MTDKYIFINVKNEFPMVNDVKNKLACEYPSYRQMTTEWGERMSPWIKGVLTDIIKGRRDEAAAKITSQKLDRLLQQENSSQKVFDMFAVSAMLTALQKHEKAKSILIELSQIVPSAHIYADISVSCKESMQVTERLKYIRKAYEMTPEDPAVWSMLSSALIASNRLDEGLDFAKRSVDRNPYKAETYSSYLFNLHYQHELDCEKIFQEHKRWASYNAVKDSPITSHENDSDPERKLRIGYISADFKTHPVGLLIRPIMQFHDRDKVEVFAYGRVALEDALSAQIKDAADHYRGIYTLSEKEIVEKILEDKIDILIDLAGHTGGNCLEVLAHKPAPVQATYLGYFDTTGMEQVDYFLTDIQMSPPESRKYHTEELMYFPQTCFCYNLPKTSRKFDVVESPVVKNGFVTFGMFSNPAKINPKILGLWAKVLCNLPTSRLKMIMNDGDSDEIKATYYRKFEDAGVSSDRIDIRGKAGYGDYLDEYGKVDIMFDTYPYCGGATTCDAFWMGVPVISLVGEHHFSRVGLSLLTAVGLEYFACKNEDEYVAKGIVLASKPDALNKIRFQLRQRMMASDMSNPKKQAANMENAYRQMWRKWCMGQQK